MTNNNDDIKGRMMRHASAIWGVQNTDALDPLVRIMVEALAGELQKTHYDIDNFEKRILEKVAQLMTPSILAAPYCAHAIAYAQPVEPKHLVSRKTQFFFPKKVFSEKEILLNVFFTPVGDVPLFDANVKFVVSGNTAFATTLPLQKTLHIKSISKELARSLWLGIRLNPQIKEVHKLSFYFDFRNTSSKKQLLSLFHQSSWQTNNSPLTTTKGLSYAERETNALFADADTMDLIEKEVSMLYDEHFVTISDPQFSINPQEQLRKYPESFEQQFAKNDLANFKEDLLWIKITTPVPLDEKFLTDLVVSMNSFPVLNRKLKDFFYRLKGLTNIVPLPTESFESFLSVESLKDSANKHYSQVPFAEESTAETGTFSLRKSGTERIDPRASKEYLAYLVELIRDESAIFSGYGQDTVINLIKELDKLLAQMEQRIRQQRHADADSSHYLVLEYPKKQESFFTEYWVNNNIHGNGIHAGAKLNLYKGSEIKADAIFLLSSSLGGKPALEPERHMDAYKFAVLSHNRIMTVEDIKAFCLHEMGNKLKGVTVRKGLVKSDNPREGLIRCVEIVLERKELPANELEENEWVEMLKTLESKVEMRSALNLKFRFSVKELQS